MSQLLGSSRPTYKSTGTAHSHWLRYQAIPHSPTYPRYQEGEQDIEDGFSFLKSFHTFILWIIDESDACEVTILYSMTVRPSTQAKWRIAVGHQQECVGLHPQTPAGDTNVKVKEASRVSTGHQDGTPGYDISKKTGKDEKKQDEVVRDRKQPLDQGIPSVEFGFRVGVIDFQVDRLLLVGGRVSVREQACIGADPGLESN